MAGVECVVRFPMRNTAGQRMNCHACHGNSNSHANFVARSTPISIRTVYAGQPCCLFVATVETMTGEDGAWLRRRRRNCSRNLRKARDDAAEKNTNEAGARATGKEVALTREASSEKQANDERLLALERLLENPEFRASDRNKRFLRFVVEETVAGRADRIKAFTIAVDVFGRDANFDATVDPIVRIAAGQLRKSLREYYAEAGQGDVVQIAIPLGAYVPTFDKRSSTSAFMSNLSRGFNKGPSLVAGAALLAAAALAVSTYAPVWLGQPGKSGGGGAVLLLDSARANPSSADATQLANMLNDALWLKVGRKEGIRSVGVRPEEKLDAVSARVRETYGAGSNVYELLTSVQVESDEVRIYWHLLDSDSREVQVSSRMEELLVPDAKGDLADAIASRVAASLFGYEGVLAHYQAGARVAARSPEE
ncbi:hypothetical protein JYP52_19650 [Nitratireductor aquibiodomus]|uniref:hypothetical protein n=1 Tax=Nitratireductor aquibiodomus TaxID=204799 RepID=UPI0019D32923|nr:hypothetical protein [Nitratireductor aquibiodomus]MBN7763362.1 hypothetical protein [Nitratireductor aquibiodomus]